MLNYKLLRMRTNSSAMHNEVVQFTNKKPYHISQKGVFCLALLLHFTESLPGEETEDPRFAEHFFLLFNDLHKEKICASTFLMTLYVRCSQTLTRSNRWLNIFSSKD